MGNLPPTSKHPRHDEEERHARRLANRIVLEVRREWPTLIERQAVVASTADLLLSHVYTSIAQEDAGQTTRANAVLQAILGNLGIHTTRRGLQPPRILLVNREAPPLDVLADLHPDETPRTTKRRKRRGR